MDSTVFVWPVEILGSIYADLVGGDPNKGGFIIKELPKEENGAPGVKLSIVFNFESKLSPTGRICLDVSGERQQGFEAETSAITAMLEALRTQYNIFQSDYSYAVISENMPIYDKLVKSIKDFSKAYVGVESCVEDCLYALRTAGAALSACLSSMHTNTKVCNIEAITSFNGWLTEYVASMTKCKTESSNLLAMMMSRDAAPVCIQRLKNTAPMPMRIDWHASFYVLHLLFTSSMRKLNAQASSIDIRKLNHGGYEASIHVPFEPKHFVGEQAPNLNAAKAKLMYRVLSYMEQELGLYIIDINHSARHHIKVQLDRFDANMEVIWTCGKRLEQVARACQIEFNEKASVVIARNSADSSNHWDQGIIDLSANQINTALSKLNIAWTSFNELKVNRAFVENSMADTS